MVEAQRAQRPVADRHGPHARPGEHVARLGPRLPRSELDGLLHAGELQEERVRAGRQACGLLPREFLGGLPASACIKRDLARARRALARTGVSNPTLEIEFPTDYVLEGMSERELLDLAASTTVLNASVTRYVRPDGTRPWTLESFNVAEHLEQQGVQVTEHAGDASVHPR